MATKNGKAVDFLTVAKKAGNVRKVGVDIEGLDVYVRSLSRREVRAIMESCIPEGKTVMDGEVDNDRMSTMIVAAATVDQHGNRLIPDGREEEMEDLPYNVFAAIQTAALAANGMTGGPEGN